MPRLLAPSTYRLVSLRDYTDLISDAEWVEGKTGGYQPKDEIELDLRILLDKGLKPAKRIAYLEYDAQNVYGALIRSTAECKFYSFEGDMSPDASEDNMKLNGMTYIDWIQAGSERR